MSSNVSNFHKDWVDHYQLIRANSNASEMIAGEILRSQSLRYLETKNDWY